MAISMDDIKKLRERTGISVMQCKNALEEAGGDMDAALEILRKQSGALADKKSGRDLKAGTVAAYVHNTGTVGTMLELLCETDFVARNEDFKQLAYDIAMHTAAMNPEATLPAGSDEDTIKEALLAQPFFKDESKTIGDLVSEAVQKFGERTELGRVVRYSIS